MRRARTGTIDRRVAVPWVGRRLAAVRPDDRRALVTLAELNADREILRTVLFHDPHTERAAGRIHIGAVRLEAGEQRPVVHDAGAAHAELHVAHPHRLP